jgi:hypothetical protein
MGCNNCADGGGLPKGCKNNGACGTDSCNKLTVFDWLGNMELPHGQELLNGLKFALKNSRKEFYKNVTSPEFAHR